MQKNRHQSFSKRYLLRLYKQNIHLEIYNTIIFVLHLLLIFKISNMKKITILVFMLSISFIAFSQTIKINEFMASNSTTIADEFGEYDDWIELYNYSTDTVNIAGFYITDTLGYKTKHQIPTGYQITKIAPHGYLILWADNDSLQTGANHLPFKLSASGEQIGLFAPDGTTAIDTISFGQQVTDISYGRYPNGNNSWIYFNFPTPGASNSILSVENIETENTFTFFPNPPTDNTISFNKPIDFSLYNSTGTFIGQYKNTSKLITEGLSQGVYFIVLDDGTKARFVILTK